MVNRSNEGYPINQETNFFNSLIWSDLAQSGLVKLRVGRIGRSKRTVSHEFFESNGRESSKIEMQEWLVDLRRARYTRRYCQLSEPDSLGGLPP